MAADRFTPLAFVDSNLLPGLFGWDFYRELTAAAIKSGFDSTAPRRQGHFQQVASP